jgi:hypothetical protein
VHEEGWFKDPYALHTDRWYSDGKPTPLVRDGDHELKDPPPASDPVLPLVPALPRAVGGEGGEEQEYVLAMDVPGAWGRVTRFAFTSRHSRAARLATFPIRRFVGAVEKSRQSPENMTGFQRYELRERRNRN